jgi:hypothetical protein
MLFNSAMSQCTSFCQSARKDHPQTMRFSLNFDHFRSFLEILGRFKPSSLIQAKIFQHSGFSAIYETSIRSSDCPNPDPNYMQMPILVSTFFGQVEAALIQELELGSVYNPGV